MFDLAASDFGCFPPNSYISGYEIPIERSKMKTFIVFISILIASTICNSQSFGWLDSIKADKFGLGVVHYNPEITQVLNDIRKEPGVGSVNRVLRTKLNLNSNDYFLIEFSPGPSDDPSFTIYKEIKHDSLLNTGSIGCNQIYLPGNGYIYTIRRNDDMFSRRQKFVVTHDKLLEIKQSYYYVGIKTITIEDVDLFADINLMIPLAFLPQNTQVEIVLNKGDKYLIKTPFGLVGWIKVKATNKTPFKDLTFHGD